MKAINYDAEGDILSVTFSEAGNQPQSGIELSDNLVLYYSPETEQPIALIMLSYQLLLQASTKSPILLDRLVEAPPEVQSTILALLKRSPLTAFLRVVETPDNGAPASRLQAVFTPDTLQVVAAA